MKLKEDFFKNPCQKICIYVIFIGRKNCTPNSIILVKFIIIKVSPLQQGGGRIKYKVIELKWIVNSVNLKLENVQ
jgi:hypothetical protein